MACRGIFNAITREQMKSLLAIRYETDLDDDACDAAVIEEVDRIEGTIRYNSPHCLDVDEAWDPIHRSLNGDQTPDGQLRPGTGRGPLKLCVLGEDQLFDGDRYIVALVKPAQVRKVAAALAKIDEAGLRKRFFRLDPKVVSDYPIDEDYFQYTWSNFAGLPAFYQRAADDGRAVLFVASL
jgi:hypothetical protein